jgi:hypothetical protein
VAAREVAELMRMRQERARTRGQLLRQELGETMDHAMRAAGHAAGGMRAAGAQMAPAAGRVRNAASHRWETTVAAFNDTTGMTGITGMAAKDIRAARKARRAHRLKERGLRRQRDRSRLRLSRVLGMLTAGVMVGAATAMVMRRRRQQWEEFDTGQALEAAGAEATGPETGRTAGATPEAGPLGEAAPEPAETPQADIYGTAAPGTEPVDELVSKSRSTSRSTPRNNRR